jgi:hypothetical protein
MELIKIITDRFQKDWSTLLIFILLGCLLACMKFELDKESYLSFLQTAAGVVAALIGFIGIFFVYKLQNIIDITKYYMGQINILKSELKIYKNNILIIQPQPDKINKQLDEIKRIIEQLDQTGHQSVVDIKLSDRTILVEIEYILKLILKNIDLEKSFSLHKESILFAMCCIFLFVISIAFNQLNFLNDSCTMIFNIWKYVKMPFTGLLFGLFFIVMMDLASMLTNLLVVDKLDDEN